LLDLQERVSNVHDHNCNDTVLERFRGDTWNIVLFSFLQDEDNTARVIPESLSVFTQHRVTARWGADSGAVTLDSAAPSSSITVTPAQPLIVTTSAAVGATSIAVQPAAFSMPKKVADGVPITLEFDGLSVVLERDIAEGDTVIHVKPLAQPIASGAECEIGAVKILVPLSVTEDLEPGLHLIEWECRTAGGLVETIGRGQLRVLRDVVRT
jgi:hypothetical protein